MKITLNKKITLTYILSSLLLIAFFFIIINNVINKSFNDYKQEYQLKRDEGIVSYLEEALNNNSLDEDVVMYLWQSSMMDSCLVTLYDENMNLLWQIDPNKGRGMMHGRMMQNHLGEYTSNIYPIKVENKIVGYVEIGQYGSILLSEEDVEFKNSLYRGMLLTLGFGIIIAIFLGLILGKQFSKPILQIKKVTDILRQGDLTARIEENSNTKEIFELSNSINYLGKSLEHQENLRKRLTSDISHELRTPLNVLQNHLEALIDGLWEPDEERLQICYNEVLRLTDLVKDVEKLTTLDNVDIELKKSSFNLKDIILPVIKKFEPSFQSKNIKTIFTLDENIKAFVDKDKITQVMVNLLSNANKFTQPGGIVTINLTKENSEAIITVADTGIGIKKEDLNNIFERFYRGDPSRSRDTGGAGLGLSIVKQIVDAHKGRIEVESIINKGTTFKIFIPNIIS